MEPDKRNGPHASTGRRQPTPTATVRQRCVMSAVVALVLSQSNERDQQLELRHRAYREGHVDGGRDQWSAGYAAAVTDVKRAQHDLVDEVGVELGRWHLCCGPCRRTGHRAGCTRCENRTRATFGQPHPDDYKAGAA
jgi:hypothetical protein